MTLDPRTVVLIEEFFGGEVCCVCGAPAQRWRGNHKAGMNSYRFYCLDCCPGIKENQSRPVEVTRGVFRGSKILGAISNRAARYGISNRCDSAVEDG